MMNRLRLNFIPRPQNRILWLLFAIPVLTLGWTMLTVPKLIYAIILFSSTSLAWQAWKRTSSPQTIRRVKEITVRSLFFIAAGFAILVTFAIALTMIVETLRFFALVPFSDFFFTLTWRPEAGQFGALPLFIGTLVITLIAMMIAYRTVVCHVYVSLRLI